MSINNMLLFVWHCCLPTHPRGHPQESGFPGTWGGVHSYRGQLADLQSLPWGVHAQYVLLQSLTHSSPSRYVIPSWTQVGASMVINEKGMKAIEGKKSVFTKRSEGNAEGNGKKMKGKKIKQKRKLLYAHHAWGEHCYRKVIWNTIVHLAKITQ